MRALNMSPAGRSFICSGAAVILCLSLALFALASCSHRSHVVREVHRDVKAATLRGNELFFRGKYEAAAREYDRARLLAMSVDDREGTAEGINNLGQLYAVAGDLAAARRKFDESLAINEEIGSKRGMAANLVNRGGVLLRQGDTAAAERDFEEARRFSRAARDRLGEAAAINHLGLVAFERGDDGMAAERFSAALKIALDLKRHRLAAACFQNLGRVRERQGDLEAALLDYQRALDEDRLVEYSIGIAQDLRRIAAVLERLGRPAEAHDHLARAGAIEKLVP